VSNERNAAPEIKPGVGYAHFSEGTSQDDGLIRRAKAMLAKVEGEVPGVAKVVEGLGEMPSEMVPDFVELLALIGNSSVRQNMQIMRLNERACEESGRATAILMVPAGRFGGHEGVVMMGVGIQGEPVTEGDRVLADEITACNEALLAVALKARDAALNKDNEGNEGKGDEA